MRRSWRPSEANRCGGSLDGLVDIAADAAQLQARRMLGQLISEDGAEQHRHAAAHGGITHVGHKPRSIRQGSWTGY